MVRRIGKMLSLQAQCAATDVGRTALAFERAVQKVSRIELGSRLGSGDAKPAPARGLIDFGCVEELATWRVEHPVVVIAFAEADLLVIGIDAVADSGGLSEIQRGVGD